MNAQELRWLIVDECHTWTDPVAIITEDGDVYSIITGAEADQTSGTLIIRVAKP